MKFSLLISDQVGTGWWCPGLPDVTLICLITGFWQTLCCDCRYQSVSNCNYIWHNHLITQQGYSLSLSLSFQYAAVSPYINNSLLYQFGLVLYFLIISRYVYCRGPSWYLHKFLQCVTHPLHHSPLSSSPHSWNSFNRSHFSIFIHEYIYFHRTHLPTPFPCINLIFLSTCPSVLESSRRVQTKHFLIHAASKKPLCIWS
jgi:hypothetical protein